MPPPEISIVIVNWNRTHEVRLACHYLAEIRRPTFEVIVLDNHSTDWPSTSSPFPQSVRWIQLGENWGPCRARNVGAKLARGEFLFFLDSDAVLSKRALSLALSTMRRFPRAAVVGCRIIHPATRQIDQWIYSRPPSRPPQLFEAHSFSAAGAIVRRQAFLEVGGFNEKFFIYNEEVDLSFRLLRKGYSILYDAKPIVFHRAVSHGRIETADYFRLMLRNWIWIFQQYYPWPARWGKMALYLAVYGFKCVRQGVPGAWIRGAYEAFSRLSEFTTPPDEKLALELRRGIGALLGRNRIRAGR